MTELFRSGFEEQVLTATYWNTVSGTATYDSGTVHSGTYSLKIFPSGSSACYVRRDFSNPSSGTLYSRFYINVTQLWSAGDASIYEHQSSAVVQELMVRLMRDGKIRLENMIAGSTDQKTTTTVLSTGTWYRIEVQHPLSASASMVLKLYLGESTTELDTLTTASGNCLSTNMGLVYYGQRVTPNSACQFYLDDVGVNNDSGSSQNTWLGPGKMYLATPISDTAVAWTRFTGTTNWENVDDLPSASVPDDDTTYNSDSGVSNEDKFGITSPPGSGTMPSNAVMKVMSLWCRARAGAATPSGTFALKIWNEAGTGTQGPTITVSGTGWIALSTINHQNYDLTGKTKADMDLFKIGYKALSGAVEKRVTALWANVEWTEALSTDVAISGSVGTGGHGTSVPGIEIPL